MNWTETKTRFGVFCQLADIGLEPGHTWQPVPGQPVTRKLADLELVQLHYSCEPPILVGQVKTVFNPGTEYEEESLCPLRIAYWDSDGGRWRLTCQ